jgi:hypothetical protein
MSDHRFTINVAIRHPAWRSERIAAGLALEPYNAWSVGDRRVTPTGTELPGVRQDTMCSFRSVHDDDQVTSAVVAAVEYLLLHRAFIDELTLSGGALTMNIRLNGQFNSNVDLGPGMLNLIGSLGMRMSVESFPDG